MVDSLAMSPATPDEVLAYLKRWELVRSVEDAELRNVSAETKLRQLLALMAGRHAFAADPNREDEIVLVRERWARLRRASAPQ